MEVSALPTLLIRASPLKNPIDIPRKPYHMRLAGPRKLSTSFPRERLSAEAALHSQTLSTHPAEKPYVLAYPAPEPSSCDSVSLYPPENQLPQSEPVALSCPTARFKPNSGQFGRRYQKQA
jgi:hypothetical protein